MNMNLIIPKAWIKKGLRTAGLINIFLGCWLLYSCPQLVCVELSQVEDFSFWIKSISFFIITTGVGLSIAAPQPFIQWPILLVSFVQKVYVLALFATLAYTHQIVPIFGLPLLISEIIFTPIIAYTLVLAFEYEQHKRELMAYNLEEKKLKSLSHITTNHGKTLQELNAEMPVLLVFLRHFGCTFCRESLKDISLNLPEIESNAKVVLVHMVDYETAQENLEKYGLEHLEHISDPNLDVYHSFGLGNGTIYQLFGFPVLVRGIIAGIFKRHSIGTFVGNGFQMPGVFLLHNNTILHSFVHTTAADRPDYVELSKTPEQDMWML
jgi:hypothetical protein